MNKRRVVITGMGVVSPIGNNVNDYWTNLTKGVNGIDNITLFDASDLEVKIAGEIKNLDFESYLDKKSLNRMDRFTILAMIATQEAVKQSSISNNPKIDLNRVGVIVGSGIGGINTFSEQHVKLLKNPKRVSPFFIPALISDIASGHISIKYGFKGPNYGIVSACATATHAIGNAFRTIQSGDADIIISGGCEASIHPLAIAGFSNMKALSKNTNPSNASRPFDLNRDGFVLSEGAGIIILEEYTHAIKRDIPILGEIIGYSATADAYHLTSPAPNGEGAAQAMINAINDANISIYDINYINAHGTSTPYNDKNETSAIKMVFKEHAKSLYVSSSKSMTGHLLGAAGGIEAIACIRTALDNIIPPTKNYKDKDPLCDLNYVPNKSKKINVDFTISNTFGFGGHNAVIVMKKYE